MEQPRGGSTPRQLARTRKTVSTYPLGDLRELRNLIKADIERVAYWIRLMEARIDTLTSSRHVEEIPDRILSVTASQTIAFATVMSYKGKMPDPSSGWARRSHRMTDKEVASMKAEMATYVEWLQVYRVFLKERLDIVTEELIGRYRDNPSLIETLLPIRETPTLADRDNGR